MIKEFDLTSIKKFSTSTSSKGNQNKWHYKSYWIKEDYLGYEGLSEVICSRIAKGISFPYKIVEYYPCIINHGSNKTVGCYSYDFSNGMSVITLHRLFETLLPDVDLYEILNERITPLERINRVLSYLTPIINNFDALKYLTAILEFDALVYNEDRHCNNIIFLYDDKEFYPAPLFDCGAGLLSDLTSDYPINKSMDVCIREVKNNAKPFSKSFKKQCLALHQLNDIVLNPDISFELDISDLVTLYSKEVIDRVCKLLKVQFSNITIISNSLQSFTETNLF